VGLVDDGDVVLGQDAPVAGEVEPVEVQVDDDDVGLLGPGPGPLGEAPVAPGAAHGAGAVPRARADGGPRGLGGLDREVGPVAGGGGAGPRGQGRDLAGVGRLGEPVERPLPPGAVGARQLGQPLYADVVRPPLEDRPGEVAPEVLVEEREVLGGELVLERPRGGGDDDPPLRHDGRHEVGQRLPGAGPGPHDEVPPRPDRVVHGGRHLGLPLARLAAPGQRPDHPPEGVGEGGRGRSGHGRRR
jgi:hypothetical protein